MEATRSKGNNVRVLKEANKYLILQCIMKLAPLSIEDVVQHTGLSRPTVLNIVKTLMEEEIIVKDGFSDTGVGRSAALLNLNDRKHFALGVDFEFPAIRMAIADMGGEINGKKIELLTAHHQNKADIASARARDWFDTQKMDMLIGGTNSATALSMSLRISGMSKGFKI